MTTWKELITEVMLHNQDSFANLVHSSLTDEELSAEFESEKWDGPNGKPFLLWTRAYVYFPLLYDGSEWVGSAPRNPNPNDPTLSIDHQQY